MYCVEIYGQGKVNISVGFGVPELIHVGLHKQLNQTQIGFSIGFIPKKKSPFYLFPEMHIITLEGLQIYQAYVPGMLGLD